jgi:hypothetical protein
MVMADRRSFVGGILGGIALCCIPGKMKGVEDGKYDKAWDEAIEENKNRDYVSALNEHCLREWVGYLMERTNTGIVYIGKDGGGKEMFSKRGFFGGDVPVRHLKAAEPLFMRNFVWKGRGDSYKYSTVLVGDKSMQPNGRDLYLNNISWDERS